MFWENSPLYLSAERQQPIKWEKDISAVDWDTHPKHRLKKKHCGMPFFSFTHCAPNKVSVRPIVISWWNLIELASESLFDGQIIKKVYRLCSTFIPGIDCREIKCGMDFSHPLHAKQSSHVPHSLWVDCAWATTVCLINWCVRAVSGGVKQQAENRLFARESFSYYLKSSTPANSR